MDKSTKTPRRLLVAARKERLWSQQEIASLLGTTQHNISRWEQGATTPSPYFSKKLCELFGKSAQELGLFSEADTLEEQMPAGELVAESSQTPLAPTAQPLSLWTVPYPRNPHFTGRDTLLEQLDQHFSAEKTGEQTTLHSAALTQPQAIKGLGGIGKTQIAVEYAYRAREQGRYTHILWINTASAETIMASFVALADLLPDFAEKNETNQLKLVAAIKRWLEQCPQRWLLIFDNADDPTLVQEYLPQYGRGSILLTTRASAVGSVATSIEVETMSFVEGTQLLRRRAQRLANASDEEINEAGNIVVALDHFPLALDQAGAYIEETRCSFATYLQLLQDHRQALLARRGTQATYYPDSVATTWSLSFQKVEQQNPAAAELLRVCAFLAPDHIPEELLIEGREHWPPALQQAATDLFTFNQMLQDLLAFSLVKRLADQQMLSIHRLVQIVQIDAMTPEEQRQWAERVVRAVHAVFPQNPKEEVAHWPQCLRYLEQAQVCYTLIQQYQLLLPEAADLLDRSGTYLYEHASYTLAEPLYQKALGIWRYVLGAEHTQLASSLNNLAELYRQQGKYTQAEPLYQQALQIWKQQLGAEHLQVATPLYGLAILYKEQGKYTEAEALYQQALTIYENQLGAEHLQVATPLYGLAILYKEQGKYTEAEALYQRTLRIREQQLGPEHPLVAYPLNGLALLYSQQGRYMEAEPLYQRAMLIWEQQLGPDHPLVAVILNNLGILYREQGRHTEAEPLYQRAMLISEQRLGPEHLSVAALLNNLAELYRDQGRYAEAEPLYQRSRLIREPQLGAEHHLVSDPLNGLANLYREQGKYTQAEALFQQVLRMREQQLGPDHPDTAESVHDFASLREAQGNFPEAISLYSRALTIREHVLGAEHPRTIETRTKYLALLDAMNREEEPVEGKSAPVE